MPRLQLQTPIDQLDKNKGGYYYLKVDAETVNLFEHKKKTRLKCIIENQLSFSCGLNHYGDGNFFIIVSTKRFNQLKLEKGQLVHFEIFEDPNPLGVEVPEVLQVLLDQDSEAKATYEAITDGKKRSLIYTIKPVKDLDKQVEKILAFLQAERIKLSNKQR